MSIENQILLIKEYGISAEEWFFVQLLFLAQPEENQSNLLLEYLQHSVSSYNSSPREMLLHFQEVGIVNKSYKVPSEGDIFDPESVEFNKNFLHRYFKYSGDLGQELFNNYPINIIIRDTLYTLRNIAKKYNSMEEFSFAYAKAIGHSPKKHKEVMDLLEWAKSHGLVNFNICEFVISRKWLDFESLRNNGFDGNSLKIDELI